MQRRQFMRSACAVVALSAALAVPAFAQKLPAGYPADYSDLVAKAKKEGAVSIYSSTDSKQAQGLVDAFQATYPGIKVEFNDIGTNGAYNRVLSEAAAKQVGSDIVWTSAMDLQMILVDKGLADTYKSPEAQALPGSANFRDMLYGTSVEPAAVFYNKKLLPADWVPKTRSDLIKLMKDHKADLKGKVATMDPEKSGTGFFFATNDLRNTKDFWELAAAFGGTEGKVYGSSGAIREKVVSGEHVLSFNVIGSYALEWARENPNLGVAFMSDFSGAFARVAMITKGAPHPAAARLFLDFLLSDAGQKAMGAVGVPSIRTEGGGVLSMTALRQIVGPGLKPTPVDENLTYYMDPKRRAEFFQQWKKTMRGE